MKRGVLELREFANCVCGIMVYDRVYILYFEVWHVWTFENYGNMFGMMNNQILFVMFGSNQGLVCCFFRIEENKLVRAISRRLKSYL